MFAQDSPKTMKADTRTPKPLAKEVPKDEHMMHSLMYIAQQKQQSQKPHLSLPPEHSVPPLKHAASAAPLTQQSQASMQTDDKDAPPAKPIGETDWIVG